jgi:predicted aspartyl protease
MRQSMSSGTGGSIRARRLRSGSWTVAASLFALTGCLESAAVLNDLHGDPTSIAPVAVKVPDSTGSGRAQTLPDASRVAPGPSPPSVYSDEFWMALADLDLPASRVIARGEPEVRFADAIGLLAMGDYEQATDEFIATSTQTTDLSVAVASQSILAATLMYEHKWEFLRDLSSALQVAPADRANISELELWGKAFAGLDPQVIQFPRDPVALRLGISALGTPTVRVRINGKYYQFWLDTGSSISVLSSSVAAEVGAPTLSSEKLRVGTFAGIAAVTPALLRRMEIGPIVISNSPTMVMDASLMRVRASAEGVPWSGLAIDGIIGWDIIRRIDMTMDFENATLILRRPEKLGTIGTGAQNLIWLGKPFVRVRTTRGETVHFTLDTGAQSTFVDTELVRRLGVPTSNTDTRVFGIGKNGGQPVRVVPSLRLEVSGKSLLMRDLLICTPSSSGIVDSDGILGSDVGRLGTIRIDATNGLFSIVD